MRENYLTENKTSLTRASVTPPRNPVALAHKQFYECPAPRARRTVQCDAASDE
jgi:hypothetical protein